MNEKENQTLFVIPTNYTDSGKLFGGMLETRNALEAILLLLVVGYPELKLIPMPMTLRIVTMAITLIPIVAIALIGIDGYSLFQYMKHIVHYLMGRRKLRLRRVGYPYEPRQPRQKKHEKTK